ncbi:MAG: HPF/RaiA family ribosome-associated protein [Kofleriaceae bacterium]
MTNEITFRGMDPSPAAEAEITRCIIRVRDTYERITRCDVVVEQPHRHHRQGKVFHVRIEVTIPGGVINVSRDPGTDHAHEDLYAAIADAFRAARRQLQGYAEQRRGDVKLHA